MHALIAQHRDEIANLCRRFGVRRLEVFGSAARGTDFDPATSDADFLVSFGTSADHTVWGRTSALALELERVIGRPVDLINPDTVVNPYILASINRAREPIYGA